jgi:hypothetical protein
MSKLQANKPQMTILLIKSVDSTWGNTYYLRRSQGTGQQQPSQMTDNIEDVER